MKKLKEKKIKDLKKTWVFTELENELNFNIFHSLCPEKKKAFQLEQLKTHLKDNAMGSRYASQLFSYMLALDRHHRGTEASYENFTLLMIHGHKGTCESRSKLLFHLLEVKDVAHMRQLLYAMCREAGNVIKSTPTWISVQPYLHRSYSHGDLLNFFLHVLIYSHTKKRFEVNYVIEDITEFSEEKVEMWMQNLHIVHHLLHYAFAQMFPIQETGMRPLIPQLALNEADSQRAFHSLLDLGTLIIIAAFLPHQYRKKWTLLFSNQIHGDSFAGIMQRVVGNGPFVFIVRDSQSYIFGGYCSDTLVQDSRFYGNPSCLIFSLYPHIDFFTTTGLNDNFVYFNYALKTLPIGFGMGGQLGYHGIWIDGFFGQGHSRTKTKNTTFGSPVLSSTSDFHFTDIEFWDVTGVPDGRKRLTTRVSTAQVKDAIEIMELTNKPVFSERYNETLSDSDLRSGKSESILPNQEISILMMESLYKMYNICPFIDESPAPNTGSHAPNAKGHAPKENISRPGYPDEPAR